MLRETLSQTHLLDFPLYAFFIFLATFVVVVVRVMAHGRKDAQAAAMALLPLEADTENPTDASQRTGTPRSAAGTDAQTGDDR